MVGYIGFIVIMIGACFLESENIIPAIAIMIFGLVMIIAYGIKQSTHDR